jgi:hypothetical protein
LLTSLSILASILSILLFSSRFTESICSYEKRSLALQREQVPASLHSPIESECLIIKSAEPTLQKNTKWERSGPTGWKDSTTKNPEKGNAVVEKIDYLCACRLHFLTSTDKMKGGKEVVRCEESGAYCGSPDKSFVGSGAEGAGGSPAHSTGKSASQGPSPDAGSTVSTAANPAHSTGKSASQGSSPGVARLSALLQAQETMKTIQRAKSLWSSTGLLRQVGVTWPVHSSPCFPSHSSRFSLGAFPSGLQKSPTVPYVFVGVNRVQRRRGTARNHAPGTHDMGPFGSFLEFDQGFWQRKQILMQAKVLPNAVNTFKTEGIHPHDSLLIHNDLCQQLVPVAHGHTLLTM